MQEQKTLRRYSVQTSVSHPWLRSQFSHNNLKEPVCDLCAYRCYIDTKFPI